MDSRDEKKQVVRISRDLAERMRERARNIGISRDSMITIVLREFLGDGVFNGRGTRIARVKP